MYKGLLYMKKIFIYLICFILIIMCYSYCSTERVIYSGDKWVHLSGGSVGDTFHMDVDCHISWPFFNTKNKSVALTLFAKGNRLFLFIWKDFSVGVYECKDSYLWDNPDFSSDSIIQLR